MNSSFRSQINYPDSRNFKLTLAFTCSVFIYLFLIFFQPFGVNNYSPNDRISLELALGIAGIIPVIFLTIWFDEFILRPHILLSKRPGYIIAWIVFIFINVGTTSFLFYNFMGNFHDFVFQSYIRHVIELNSVLVFPFLGTLFFYNYYSITKNYHDIVSISPTNPELNDITLIRGEYKNDQIALRLNTIVCIHSEDNYIELSYIEDDVIKKHLIRSTLSHIEQILDNEIFVRCNRSTIINLLQLESVKKLSSVLFIKMNLLENPIKVSKSNAQNILDLAEKHFSSDKNKTTHP